MQFTCSNQFLFEHGPLWHKYRQKIALEKGMDVCCVSLKDILNTSLHPTVRVLSWYFKLFILKLYNNQYKNLQHQNRYYNFYLVCSILKN